MSSNKNMHKAKAVKNDEFYTQYNDIAAEIKKYADQLKGKHILCPCDWDAQARTIISEEETNLDKCNFAKYLNAHFKEYKLKSITVSGYNPATGVGIKFQESIPEFAKKHPTGIVITNPPWSLFREFIATIVKFPKLKFLVVSNKNAITYKEIFPLIKNNKLWLGYSIPSDFVDGSTNQLSGKLGGLARWFTNLDVSYRHDELVLCEYDPEKYPKYDNYDAINVNKVNEIPDYDGVMGVPITFLSKYNPKQFKIIGLDEPYNKNSWRGRGPEMNGKTLYRRMLIQKLTPKEIKALEKAEKKAKKKGKK